jgi:hypothetical protein
MFSRNSFQKMTGIMPPVRKKVNFHPRLKSAAPAWFQRKTGLAATKKEGPDLQVRGPQRGTSATTWQEAIFLRPPPSWPDHFSCAWQ